MISVVPFEPEHAARMPELMDVFSKEGDVISRITEFGKSDTCIMFSVIHEDGRVLGVVGGHYIWETSMHIFAAFAKCFAATPLAMVKSVEKAMRHGFKELGILRMQIDIRTCEAHLHKWARLIGFEKECDMKNYGPDGETYSLYARYF